MYQKTFKFLLQSHAAKQVMKHHPTIVHQKSPIDGWTALHHAAASSQRDMVKALVKAKADVTVCAALYFVVGSERESTCTCDNLERSFHFVCLLRL